MAQFTIGLDLGHYQVKRVRLRSSFRAAEIVDFRALPVPQDERPLPERLAEALAGFDDWNPGDLVATALPGNEVTIRMLQLPFRDRKRISQTIGFEIASQVPFQIDDIIFDYQLVGTTPGGGGLVMAAVCRKERLGSWLQLLDSQGIDPRLLGPDALATASLADWLLEEDPDDCLALLDVGHQLSTLLCIGHQGPQFARSISGGGWLVTRQLCRTFSVDPQRAEEGKHRGLFVESERRTAEQPEQVAVSDAVRSALQPLVREVRQSLVAQRALSAQPVRRLFLCGGGGCIGNLDNYLAEQLQLPVEFLRTDSLPIEGIDKLPAPASGNHSPEWAKALGLAWQAHQGGRRGWLNLRRGPFAFRGDFEVMRGRLLRVAVAVAILLILAIGNVSVHWASLSSAANAMNRRMDEVTKAILGKSYRDIDVALSIMKEKISPTADPLPRVTALDVLREMHQRVPEDIKLRFKDLNISPKRIQLTGFTDSFESVEKIRTSLEQFKCFSDIQTGKTQKTAKGDEVEFRFTIAFAC